MTPSQRVSAVFAEQFEQQPDLLVRAPGGANQFVALAVGADG